MKRTARVIVASAGTIAVTLGAAVFAIEQALALGFQGIDDANIFLRYARNLVEGHGFSYNPESGGVQGFTSELWLVCCAYAEFFGEHRSTALVIASVAVIAAAFVAVVLVSSRALRRVGAARSATRITLGVAVAVLATHPAWFAWHVSSLMDAALYAFVLVVAWAGLESFRQGRNGAVRGLTWAAMLLVWCRPEGPAWMVLLAASVVLVGKLTGRSPIDVRAGALSVLAAGGASLVLLLAWRWSTFGVLLPNTVYAKVSLPLGERLGGGVDYWLSYCRQQWPLLGAAAALTTLGFVLSNRSDSAACRQRVLRRRRAFVLTGLLVPWVWVVAGWCIPIAAGGDAFGGHRFYQALLLLLIPPSALGVAFVLLRLPRAKAAGVVGALLVLVVASIPFEWSAFFRDNGGGPIEDISRHVASGHWIAGDDRRHGERIAEFFARKTRAPAQVSADGLPRIAYAAAGGIAVGYRGVVFDMMGLNDPILARGCENKRGPLGHACFDRDYFFRLSPDILLPRATPRAWAVDLRALDRELNRPGNWDNTIFRGIFADPEFRRRYRLVRLFRRGSPWAVHGYFRTEFLLPLLAERSFEVAVP